MRKGTLTPFYFGLTGLVVVLAGCGSGGTTKQGQTTTEPSLVQVTVGAAQTGPIGKSGKVSYSPIPTNVRSVGLRVTAADIVPVFAVTNVTAGAVSATLTVSVPPGPARTFGVNAYDGLLATGTVLYQGLATVDIPPNTAVNVPIVLGFLGGSTIAPTKPTGLLASSFTVGQIRLDWPPTETSESVTGYVLYMAEIAWTAPWKATLPGAMRHPGLGCCTFTHFGLSSTTTYYFALATVNAIGEAPESAQVSAIPNGGGGAGGGASEPTSNVTLLASGLDNPLHIAVDPGSLGSVYWSEDAATLVSRIATVSKTGGTVVALATGLTKPDDINIDLSSVFWGEDRASGNIGAVPKSGGPVSLISTGLSSPATVALSSLRNAVFWLENPPTAGLKSISKTGGLTSVFVSNAALVSHFTDLVLYENATQSVAYWTTTSPSIVRLWSYDFGLNSVSTMTSVSAPGHQLAVDDNFVYWAESLPANSGAVNKISRCCSVLTSLAGFGSNNPGAAASPFAVAVDNLFVYWTELNATPNGAIKKVLISGLGSVTVLASNLNNPKTLAVDDSFVYWTEANPAPNGKVKKIAK